jgi:hypothetical protein
MSKKLMQNIKPATEHEVLVLAKGIIDIGDVDALFPEIDQGNKAEAGALTYGIALGWNRREELNTLVEAEEKTRQNAASVAGLIQKVGFDEFFAQLRNLGSEMQNDPEGFAEKFGVARNESKDELLDLIDVVIVNSTSLLGVAETVIQNTLMTHEEQLELMKNPEGVATLMDFHLEEIQAADEHHEDDVKQEHVARYAELKALGKKLIERSPAAWPFSLRSLFEVVTAEEVYAETAAAEINEGELVEWITDQIENGHSGFTTEISTTMARYALTEPAELRLELAERMGLDNADQITSVPRG